MTFDYNNMDVTAREVILSISVVLLFVAIMIMFTFYTQNVYVGRNDIYDTADIYEKDDFNFALAGSTGRAFIDAEITVDEFVTFPELENNGYVWVERVEQKYTQHTRLVSYKCGDSTCTRPETYWTWDVTDRDKIHVDNFYINGYQVDWDEVNVPGDYTISPSGNIDNTMSINNDKINDIGSTYVGVSEDLFQRDTRYYYQVVKLTDMDNGTVFVNFEDEQMAPGEGSTYKMYDSVTPEQLRIDLQKSPIGWIWFIWTFGSIVMGGILFGFYYLDNRWLND